MGNDGIIQSLLRDGCHELELDIDRDGLAKLETYYLELRRWSRRMNLIGKNQSAEAIIADHFLDSLLLLPHFSKQQSSLVDVGSGAGFPGLVCKAVEPQLVLKLVEPRLKRVSFLRHIIRCLELDSVEVVAERVENVEMATLSSSHIVSRALADIAEFLGMIEGIVNETTRILCMKGPKWEEELILAQPVIDQMQLKLVRRDEFFLPYSGKQRFVLTFGKR